MPTIPPAPAPDAMLDAAQPNGTVLEFLNARRSCSAPLLREPGPTPEQLDDILRLAARIPDHRRLAPWRFLIFEGEARHQAGDLIARRYAQCQPSASEEDLALERRRFSTAPIIVAVISSPDFEHKTPVWEQELSAGALCYNLLLVANAAGFAGNWLSYWMAFDAPLCASFGVQAHERIAGFIYLGTNNDKVPERPRPLVKTLTSRWHPA